LVSEDSMFSRSHKGPGDYSKTVLPPPKGNNPPMTDWRPLKQKLVDSKGRKLVSMEFYLTTD